MDKSRLYELFLALPPSDLKALRKLVRSPFFNQREHVEKLFFYLDQARKSGLPAERRLAFAYIWPDKTFDDHKLRLSMSLLLKTMEQYLIWKQSTQNETLVKLQLANAYSQLGLERHFNTTMAAVERRQEEQPLRDAVYYEQRQGYYQEQYHFNARQNRMKGLPLEEVQTNFDIAYLAAKLKQSCLMLSHQAIYNKAYDFGMLPEALAYIERKAYLQYPAISVYYYAYKSLIRDDTADYFSTFKALIFENYRLFPPDEIRDLFLLATNYCIQQRNQGWARYNEEGLDIFKEGLKSGVLLQNGVLSNFTYRNIVAMAIVAKDFDWAAEFVEAYRELLAPKYRESSFSFNMALLKYEQKDYDGALELINQISSTDVLNNLSTKTIALKIYNELGDFELLHSHLDAMRSFLNRKKILAYHKEHYANTIKFTKKLLDLPTFAKERRLKLKLQIEATAAVAEKEWLLGILE